MGLKPCFLDFETRSRVPLSKGLDEYIKSMKVLCMGFKGPNGEPVKVLEGESLIRDFCLSLIPTLKRNYIAAHSTEFDFTVFQHLTGCDDHLFYRFIDTALMSRYFSGPFGLQPCGGFWNLSIKKDYGKDVIEALSKPLGPDTKLVVRGIECAKFIQEEGFCEHPELTKHLKVYCKKDVEVCEELFKRLSSIPYFYDFMESNVRKNAYINFLRNRKGIRFDLNLCSNLINDFILVINKFKEVSENLTYKGFNINSYQHIKDYLKRKGHFVPDTKASNLKEVKRITPDNNVKRVIDCRLNRPNGREVKRLLSVIENADKRGHVKNTITLYGAITGRYTAFDINPLNLPRGRGSLEDYYKNRENNRFLRIHKDMSARYVMSNVRKIVIPFKGEKFLGCDFSGIEFKLLMLLAGETEVLKKIYKGWDFYKAMASKVFSVEYDSVDYEKRYICKRVVLARGYGLGYKSFIVELASEGIKLTNTLAQEAYNMYFKMCPKVPKLWEKLYRPFNDPERGDTVIITIPFSKRKIRFTQIQTIRSERNRTVYRHPTKGLTDIFPSKLCGEVTQGLALDVYHDAERRIFEKFNTWTIIPVHDEFLLSILTNFDKKGFLEEVQKTPDFLPKILIPSLPVESWEGDRYGK